jgi:ribosome biogenesis GTPase
VSKRRLNDRQRRRIAHRRSRGAVDAGDDPAGGDEQAGTVIAQYGQQVDLLDADGETRRCFLRANLETPVAGDRVIFRAGDSDAGEDGVVVALQPRHSALQRPDKFGALRTIAANIDLVVIVVAPLPEPHANLIDRYLVATEVLGAEALIFLNKCDLLDAPDADALDTLLAPYRALGYTVLRGAARDAVPAALREALSGRDSILVGQSGVGKSTLLNALLPAAEQRIGALSEEVGKGRHTTTTARRFSLPSGGALIDSPGIREFGLWHLDRGSVQEGFREIRALAGECRFRDCRHEGEPGCAVIAAAEDGRIDPQRLASYRRIIASIEEER